MRPARLASAALAAAAACVTYGVTVERRWYRLRHLRVRDATTRPLPAPLRILHISDLHLDPPQGHKVRFVRGLAASEPDLVVITGDLLGAVGAEDEAIDALADLVDDDRPGVIVLGSNDLFGPTPKGYHSYFTDPSRRIHGVRLDTDRLIAGLEKHGYTVLRDTATVLPTTRGPVAVGGVDDPHLKHSTLPPLDAIRAPRDGDVVARLGLVHAPYTAALDLLVDAGYDLLLAGHTHGGQVRFPPIGALVGNCDLPLDQIRGLSRWRDTWLHVSPGLGTSRYAPFRFACRPEATLLDLV